MNPQEIVEMFKITLNRLRSLPTIGRNGWWQNAQNQLVFPIYHGNKEGDKRISEQEARFIFAMLLHDRSIPFSVEVPTDKVYKFGKNVDDIKNTTGGRSASHDLVFYPAEDDKICVEFKAGGGAAPHSVTKDVFKLAHCEYNQKYFYHVIDDANKSTFDKLKGKFQKALTYAQRDEGRIEDIKILVAVIGNNSAQEYPGTLFQCNVRGNMVLEYERIE